jgi:2-polyprenyl-3-methyl-5-hydroxy-6-metoxy-1,4-benzoquinol methylase
MIDQSSYNERLFQKKGLRSFFHNARFLWFLKTSHGLNLEELNVLELGCFDGRLLEFMPQEPAKYQGIDAGTEGGIDVALMKFKGHERYHFNKSNNPGFLGRLPSESFNLAVALETIEHIEPSQVEAYLLELARVTNGFFLVSVPNEKGVVFALKWLAKKCFYGSTQPYTFGEWISALFGRLDRVERDDHKGFDYLELIRAIEKYFDVVRVEAAPFSWLPLWASFTVCILAKSKPR